MAEPISFILDLDAKDFMEAGHGALSVIEAIGDPSKLEGLIAGLGKAVEVLGVVALAAEAFKVALDLTLEGEKIQQVQTQFDALATSAGLSGEALKRSMEEASGGLVSTTDLLKTANKALLELGPSASHLPEVLTLSRQAVTLFGGDVKTTFDEMTQALANGNERWLKHHGIIVDTNAAVQKYADEHGIAANAISAAGRQQALFNAGLAAAEERFQGVSTQTGQTTTALAAFKAAWAEFAEFIDVVISKTVGPILAKFFTALQHALHSVTGFLKSFGHATDESAAHTEATINRVTNTAITNQKALQENEAKFQAERLKLQAATAKESEKLVNSQDDIDKAIKAQQIAREQQHQQQIRQIQASTSLDASQKRTLIHQEHERYRLQELNEAKQDEKTREQLNKQFLDNSNNTWQGIGRAAHNTSETARKEMRNFGAQGAAIMATFQHHSVDAFKNIGIAMAEHKNIAQATADAMKSAFLGMIGETAEHYGEMILLESIFPPNPLGLAAGAALIAFGAAISSLAGSSSTSVSTGGGGGGGGGAISTTEAPTPGVEPSNLEQQQQFHKNVTVNIAGNYLNTQESQRTLMETLRNESDATGFTFNRIGV